MSSITTWQRLEPIPRTADLTIGLRAEIADPLWMLGRQRQFGEWRGEDAGSPAVAQLEFSAGQIDSLRSGESAARRPWLNVDLARLPLEVAVEREPTVRSQLGFAIQAGLHAARLLRAHGAEGAVAAIVDQYGFTVADADAVSDGGLRPDLARSVHRSFGRVAHGARLRDDLLSVRNAVGTVTDLPSGLAVSAATKPNTITAFDSFMKWWDAMVSEPDGSADPTWNGRQLEHQFSVSATPVAERVELRADNYSGGRLDWYSFTSLSALSAAEGQGTPQAAPLSIVRTLMPAPVSYPGMPAKRHFEIEDGTIRFGSIGTGRTDLARMLLAEFALTYGVDWFVIPVELPVGSVSVVKRFVVTDTFGEQTNINQTQGRHGSDQSGWGMFDIPIVDGSLAGTSPFVLAPVLHEAMESPPVEEVLLLRDELANVVWGVERRYEHTSGEVVDRYEEHQRRLGSAPVDRTRSDAQLTYLLATDVPFHWFPFVPVQIAGARPGTLSLERRPLTRLLAGGVNVTPEPQGRLLQATDPYQIEEEEVRRSGILLTRTYQLARGSDGRYHLWSTNRVSVGTGEGSSGLRFDSVSRNL
jgi:hypothetical protein